MNATEALRIMRDVENLPAVQQAVAEFNAEIERPTVQCAERNADALRGPYRVGKLWPNDDRTVLAICKDGEYRTVRHGDDGKWYGSQTPWEMYDNESPVYWWDLPKVTP